MALKEATGNNAISFGDGDIGKTVEGYYVDTKSVQTKFGGMVIHLFQPRDGKLFEVLGSAELDRKLAGITPRAWTSIEFLGKKAIGGGQSMKTYRVFSDDDDVTGEQLRMVHSA